MKIVQVAPNNETVPPPRDGGTERVVHELTEELFNRGHEIVLYAPEGSRSPGRLFTYPFKNHDEENIANFVEETLPPGVDLIHDHTFTSVVGRRQLAVPTLCTLHLPVDNGVKYPVYVSNRARQVGGNRGFCIYNGIRPDHFELHEAKEDYLLFMGRVIHDKGVHHVLDIAERTGMRTIIAGPLHDPGYYHQFLEPRARHLPQVSFIGPVGGDEKQSLLKRAKYLLFPSIWEEPFGLVLIEAMACGTRVLALDRGSVPEVLGERSDMICRSVEEMAEKARTDALNYISPGQLRQFVLDHFTTCIMTSRYLHLYDQVIAEY